jgi:hypothetical protein
MRVSVDSERLLNFIESVLESDDGIDDIAYEALYGLMESIHDGRVYSSIKTLLSTVEATDGQFYLPL